MAELSAMRWPRTTGAGLSDRIRSHYIEPKSLSERELRREAIGRKNWLFVGSDEGGEANATFVSLIASCRLHGLDPAEYLRDLLCLLPGWSQQRVIELSPLHWRTTVAREEVRQALAANVYRQIALGELQPEVK